jgi:hypothetical protein
LQDGENDIRAADRTASALPANNEDVGVRELAEQVSFSKKGNAFLNFGGRYPQQVHSPDLCRCST